MRKLIMKFIPPRLLKWYRQINISKFKNKDTREVFTKIYQTNYWKSPESISGTGSEINQTKSLIKDLEKLLSDLNITSLLDIPCGDFKWMQKVNLSKVDYTGADIVEELIDNNKKKYKETEQLRFKVLDLINDRLPKTDIIMVRDCLVHLSFKDIFNAIENIKASGCKYLFTTTFTDFNSNTDIITGDWRRLNLEEKPFNFPSPLLVINENCTMYDGDFSDKSMALWEINTLQPSQ